MFQALKLEGVSSQERFLGIGVTGEVVQRGERAVKRPRRYDTTKMTGARRRELEWMMEVSHIKIEKEIKVYEHLGRHEGIIAASYTLPTDGDCDGASTNRIEPVVSMPYMKHGTLQEYLLKRQPAEHLRIAWITSLAATLAFCHNRNVIHADIGSRNCLLADDLSLKLCDFGESAIIPPNMDILEVNDNGASVKTDIAQFGSVIYEISTGINLSNPREPRLKFFEYEIKDINEDDESEDEENEGHNGGSKGCSSEFDTECEEERCEWTRIEDLPRTDGIRFGAIIYKCWTRGYQNMDEVSRDIAQYTTR